MVLYAYTKIITDHAVGPPPKHVAWLLELYLNSEDAPAAERACAALCLGVGENKKVLDDVQLELRCAVAIKRHSHMQQPLA